MTCYRDIKLARAKLERDDQSHYKNHTTLTYLARRLLHQDSIKRVDTLIDKTKKARIQNAINDIIDNILHGTPSNQLKQMNKTPNQRQWLPESIRVAIKPKTLESINMRVPAMEKVVNEYIQRHIGNHLSKFVISDSTIFTAISESYKWAEGYPGGCPKSGKDSWNKYKGRAQNYWNQNAAKLTGDALLHPVFVDGLPNYIRGVVGADPHNLLFLQITEKLAESKVKFDNTKKMPLIQLSSYKNKGLFKKFLLELLDDNGHTVREKALDKESFMVELKAVIKDHRESGRESIGNAQTMMQSRRDSECKTFETDNEPPFDQSVYNDNGQITIDGPIRYQTQKTGVIQQQDLFPGYHHRIQTARQYFHSGMYGPTHSSTTYVKSSRHHPYNRYHIHKPPTPRRNTSVDYDYHHDIRPNRYTDNQQQGLLNEPYGYSQAGGGQINGEYLQHQQILRVTSGESDWQNIYQTNNQIQRPLINHMYNGWQIPIFNEQQTPIIPHNSHSTLINNQPYPPPIKTYAEPRCFRQKSPIPNQWQFEQQQFQQYLSQNGETTNSYNHWQPQHQMDINHCDRSVFNGEQPNQVRFSNQIQTSTPNQHTAVPHGHNPFFESNHVQQQYANFNWSLMPQKNDTLSLHQMQQQPLPNTTVSPYNQPSETEPAPHSAADTFNYHQQGQSYPCCIPSGGQNEAGTSNIMPTIDKLETDTTSSNNHQDNEDIDNDKSSCIGTQAISNILFDTKPLVPIEYINNSPTMEVDDTFNGFGLFADDMLCGDIFNENKSELFGECLNNISNTNNDGHLPQTPSHFRL